MKPINVWPRLYIGNELSSLQDFTFIIQAAKEPWHREALGYKTPGAPKDSDEYLIAYRDNDRRIILNLVDSPNPSYISKEIISLAPHIIKSRLGILEAGDADDNKKMLVQCNKGESRSPSLVLLFLVRKTGWAAQFKGKQEAWAAFKGLYPPFNPAAGIKHWLDKELNSYYEG